MPWRPFRREVIHCELFPATETLVPADYNSFECYNRQPYDTLSAIDFNAS